MKLLLKYYLLLFIVVGCTNTGPVNVAGWNLFNRDSTITNDIEVDQVNVHTEMNRPLTPEEVKQVKKGVEDGLKLVEELMEKRQSFMGARLHYTAAGKRDWPGWEDPNLSRTQFLERHPKMKDGHKDLITLMHEIWKIHPTFIVTDTLRNPERQKKLVAQGFSQTQKSKHLRVPAEAADVVGKRKGKIDWKDIPIFGTYQGIALGLAKFLEQQPCHIFGSRVRRVIDWKSFQDLPHHEILPRAECRNKVTLMYEYVKSAVNEGLYWVQNIRFNRNKSS